MKRYALLAAIAAIGGTVAFQGSVNLQATTPGTQQVGHSNISGTSKAGQFVANSTVPTGQVIAGDFRTASPDGRAILGNASATTGPNFGGLFQSFSAQGRAVGGIAAAANGTNYGGFFTSHSIIGTGIFGQATAATGVNFGVKGKAVSPNGFGLFSEGNAKVEGNLTVTGPLTALGPIFAPVISSGGFQGNGAMLSNVPPAGAAGGDLSGSYPNPTVGSDKITSSKLALDADSLPKVTNNFASISTNFGGRILVGSAGQVPGTNNETRLLLQGGGVTLNDANFAVARLNIGLASGAGILQLSTPGGGPRVFGGLIGASIDRGLIDVRDENGATEAQMFVDAASNGIIAADTKNFRIPNPNDPRTDIWYASVEGPEAAAYLRGTARLTNGRAMIAFPEHFSSIVVAEGMTIQLTPRSVDTYGLAALEVTPEGVTVGELQRGKGNFEFDWEVKAVRKGHETYRVIRPWDENLPADDDREAQWKSRLKSIAAKKKHGVPPSRQK